MLYVIYTLNIKFKYAIDFISRENLQTNCIVPYSYILIDPFL